MEAGDVTGRIIRQNGEPVEEVMLTFQNQTTLSNKNGEFSFKSVPTGRHLLFIDRSKLDIDEITSIPFPLEVEVLEDRETTVQCKITKGARLTGQFVMDKNESSVLRTLEEGENKIIIELKNEREQFRITSDPGGRFSFPLVRPGEWTFRIYTNSLPDGYEIETPIRAVQLGPGEVQDLSVRLKSKKRDIIFKSQDNMQPLNRQKSESLKPGLPKDNNMQNNKASENIYYSVQVGAFSKKISKESGFFGKESYDFELQIDNLHKYFIGRFSTFSEALTEKRRLENIFNNPFVVKFENERLIHIENGANNSGK